MAGFFKFYFSLLFEACSSFRTVKGTVAFWLGVIGPAFAANPLLARIWPSGDAGSVPEPWRGVAPVVVASAFIFGRMLWLNYAASLKQAAVTDLKTAHNGLSVLFESATKLFAQPVRSEEELSSWKQRVSAWKGKAETLVESIFGPARRRQFSNLGPIQLLNVDSSFNAEHDHQRSMLALRRSRLEELMEKLEEAIPLPFRISPTPVPGEAEEDEERTPPATTTPPPPLEVAFQASQEPYEVSSQANTGAHRTIYRVGLRNRTRAPLAGRARLTNSEPRVPGLGRTLAVLDGPADFTALPSDEPSLFIEVIAEDWRVSSGHREWHLRLAEGTAERVPPADYEITVSLETAAGTVPVTLYAYPNEISGRLQLSLSRPLPLREREQRFMQLLDTAAREATLNQDDGD